VDCLVYNPEHPHADQMVCDCEAEIASLAVRVDLDQKDQRLHQD
jgi:hypothetical protein